MASENVRLVSIHCYNASEDMLLNFTIPRERTGGIYNVKCMISAFNPLSSEAFVYAEFDRVKKIQLDRALQRFGATQIQIDSYSLGDYVSGTANALRFVQKKASESGFHLIERGCPSPYASAMNATPSAVSESFPMERVKVLEQAVDEADDRAQKLEEENICLGSEVEALQDKIRKIQEESEAKIARLTAENAGLVVEKEAKAAELQAKVWCLQFFTVIYSVGGSDFLLGEQEGQVEDNKLKIAQLVAENEKKTKILEKNVSFNDI